MWSALVVWLVAAAQAGGISRVPAHTWAWPAGDDLEYMGSAAAIGDFDGDGLGDVAFAGSLVDTAAANAGRVDVYHRGADGFSDAADRTFVGEAAELLLGYSLLAEDVNGDGADDLLVGTASAGVRIYLGSSSGLAETPFALLNGAGPLLARAGDVDGDGFADVLVGAADRGVVLYLGSAGGLVAGARFADAADAAAGAIDVDGDGFDDVLLGDASAEENLGVVRLYLGASGGPAPAAAATLVGAAARTGFGLVNALGDVDGDGFADIAVAATGDSTGGDASGLVRVYGGAADGLKPDPLHTLTGAYDGANLGWVMAGPADFDGDGFADLALGTRAGREVYVYPGSAAGLPTDPSDTVEYGASGVGAALGLAAGDVDDDGCDDLLVGGPGASGAAATLYVGNCPDLDGDGVSGPRDCDDTDPEVGRCDGVDLAGGCGCASPGRAAAWWPLLGLALARRRRPAQRLRVALATARA